MDMKSWIWIVVALVVGYTTCFFTLSQWKKDQLKEHQAVIESRMQTRIDALEAELEKVKADKTQWVREEVPVEKGGTAQLDPAGIVDALIVVNEANWSSNQHRLWRVIHHLEQLLESGETAIPAIQDFLQLNQDVVFVRPAAASGGMVFPGAATDSSDATAPETLRLGLIEVLSLMASPASEAALVDVLKVTGSTEEIIHLAGKLDALAPGKHNAEIASAARELLKAAESVESGFELSNADRLALFRLLDQLGDLSHLEQAKTQVVRADGRLDANALDYIMEQEGESAMDRLSNIFQNEERLRLADKLALAQRALKFVGANEQANSMYHALMLDAQIPAVIKQSLAEGMTGANQMILADAPVTADEIKTRMQILETVRATVEDAATHEAVTKASDQLQQMLNQLPVLQP
jgi:hypothetical protein